MATEKVATVYHSSYQQVSASHTRQQYVCKQQQNQCTNVVEHLLHNKHNQLGL